MRARPRLRGAARARGSIHFLTRLFFAPPHPPRLEQATRRGTESGSLAFLSEVGLLAVDESHMLGDDRGPTLEALIARLKLLAVRPELVRDKAPLSRLRVVAVSATTPNIADIGAWIGAARGCFPSRVASLVLTFYRPQPPGYAAAFGDEFRAVPMCVKVHGYVQQSSSDFLFERALKNYLGPLIAHYCDGKPVLVFCSSRKEAEESAAKVVESASSSNYQLVRTAAASAALSSAGATMENRHLAGLLPAGVGFHSAALSGGDRGAVEALFRAGLLLVLCTTSTLAQGVNLPARTVIVKARAFARPARRGLF